MPQTKVKIVISGPGSGKTTGLVKEVIKTLPNLKLNRFLVVITYTNAATDKIRIELAKSIRVPPNLFIGTIHSFLDKFVLIPHAEKLGIVPSDISFIEDLKPNNPKFRNAVIKKARDKGVITYEQIEWISEKIVCGGKISVNTSRVNITKLLSTRHAEIISKRLQFVFVDEYQDATIPQHNIFESLIRSGYIEIFYCVGDPEQYIYGFTYKQKSIKKPKFLDIPIHKIQNISGVVTEDRGDNHRSSIPIIALLNKFSKLKQNCPETNHDIENDIPAYFINVIDESEIINKFTGICARHGLSVCTKFFLSYAGSTIASSNLVDIETVINPALSSERLTSECLRLICAITCKSQKNICAEKNITQIGLRKIALSLLKKIKINPSMSEIDIENILASDYGISKKTLDRASNRNEIMFRKFLSSVKNTTTSSTNIKSTIHKSKGLEAEAVLVIAKTKNELLRWLETDEAVRASDSEDVCRLGFVAFSRAKRMLCIACLEDASALNINLTSLGLVFED